MRKTNFMKLAKRLLLGLALFVALLAGLVVILVVTFDLNQYQDTIKEAIAEVVMEQTGHDLLIEGDIKLSLYPWLGLDVTGVSLSNAKGFGDAPLLKADAVKIRTRLMPLLRNELEMDTIVLHGVTINLARNKDGVTNWSHLSAQDDEDQDKSRLPRRNGKSKSPFAALALGGIDIRDVNVYWRDQQQDVTLNVTAVTVSAGALQPGKPIEIKAGMDVYASKPALSSRIDFIGTASYGDRGSILTLDHMLLGAKVKGKAIPGGETDIKLTSEMLVDMGRGVANINDLNLVAFDTDLKGQLEIADYQSGKPAVKGMFDINGQNLPGLFGIFEIEPLASQLAGMKPRKFEIKTSFDADLKRNDVNISTLSIDILGNKINANIIARNVQSKAMMLKGAIQASGGNLPILISLASQLGSDTKLKLATLSSQLAAAPKAFSVETDFDIDLQAGTVVLPQMSINALGVKTTGSLSGKQLRSGTPVLKGGIQMSGDDLPALVLIAAALSGNDKHGLAVLGKRLKSVPATFIANSEIGSGSGAVEINNLVIKAFGATVNGKLGIRRPMSGKPAVTGEFSANGPDLPLLLLVLGSIQSKDSGLITFANDLTDIKDRGFSMATRFNADIQSANIDIPDFDLRSLGIKANGKFKGKDIQAGGNMEGQLLIVSDKPGPLLIALDQGDLVNVLRSLRIEAGINGNSKRLALKPLSLSAVFSGKQIPNSPVTLSVQADSNIDLEKEIFKLQGLKIDGLGLHVNGNATVSQFKTAPEFSGKLDVAQLDLRQLLSSLNQAVPKTADPEVLKRLAVTTDFSGTGKGVTLTDLNVRFDDSKLKGGIKLSSFSPLSLEFSLGIDQLDLDRYLPPQTNGRQQAGTPEAVATGAAIKIPTETLRAITINGDVTMGQLVMSNAKLTDLALGISADKGEIHLSPISAKLYSGTYGGEIFLDATGKEPRLTINTKLAGVQTGPLLQDVSSSTDVSGEANISLDLNTTGTDIERMKKQLSGKGGIKFLDGIFRGIDINKVLEQIEVMYESKRFGKVDTAGQTEFQSLTATMDVRDGVVRNEDMLMLGNGFKVKGKGVMVNLNDDTWKYNMTVIVDPSSVTKGEESYNIGGYDILIKCRGKIMKKRCLPDLSSMINALLKDTVKHKLLNKIGLPPIDGAKGAATDKPATTRQQPEPRSTDKTQQEAKQRSGKPEDIIKEELNKGLKKIFDF